MFDFFNYNASIFKVDRSNFKIVSSFMKNYMGLKRFTITAYNYLIYMFHYK